MKSKLFGFLAFAVVIAIILPATVNAQTKANFSGNWIFNASKSDQPQGGQGGGQRGGFGGGDFAARQDASTLTVDRTRTTPDGQTVTTTMKYTLDGKESVNAGAGGRGESRSVATWSADGKTLTITTKRTFNDQTMTSKEVWTLSTPTSLTITTTMSTPNGEMTTKRVYDKK